MDSSRPSDHIDAPAVPPPVNQPKLDGLGYLRFFWRQLTSMRTALLLLLLLAIAAIPGSLVPQRSADPNGVIQFRDTNPELFGVLDTLQVFDTYTSVWFSSIYLLLFVSLIGCVIPRTRHHLQALRTAPPKTPARLERLAGFTSTGIADWSAEGGIEEARKLLKRQGYRTRLHSSGAERSVSAERGYLRETGNLVFHSALVGILVTVGVGGGFGYTGQKIVVEGQSLTNVLAGYDTFNPGRFFTPDDLVPYSLKLDEFTAVYEEENRGAYGMPIDYTAAVTTRLPGDEPREQRVKVNEPLAIGETNVYLLGNGYAPWVTVRDGDGNVAFSQPVVFRPQDSNLTSVGVIKVPDALPEQLGMIGFFYPTQCDRTLCPEQLFSVHADLLDPTLTLEVYTGDLGLDAGVAQSEYSLDPSGLTQVAGRDADSPGLLLKLGDTVELPDGLGSVELVSAPRFAAFDIHHDPTQAWVLAFSILILGGLLTGLFVPRRRVWVKAVQAEGGTRFEYAGLARGEDPGLDDAVADLAQKHSQQLGLRLNS